MKHKAEYKNGPEARGNFEQPLSSGGSAGEGAGDEHLLARSGDMNHDITRQGKLGGNLDGLNDAHGHRTFGRTLMFLATERSQRD